MSAQPWSHEDWMTERMREIRARAGWTEGTFGRVWWIESSQHKRYAVLGSSVEAVVDQFKKGWQTDEIPAVTPGDLDAVKELAERGYETVDPYEWEPHPDHPGCIRVRRSRTIGEVADELRAYLGEEHEMSAESPIGPWFSQKHKPWPMPNDIARIVVFSVRGANEGDYVHVEWRRPDELSELLMLSKMFGGRDEAWLTARRIADLLGV